MPPPVASPERRPSDRAWWTHAFGEYYLEAYGHRDEAEARRNAPAIVALLALPPHGRVLDLGCGEGRYARALAAGGFRVTGVDLSEALLAHAMEASPMLPGAPTYVRCDMRHLPFHQQFDGVVSLFTSFGYFDDRVDDEKVLAGVARALVPGGRFLLDFLNASQVRRHLVAESEAFRGPWQVGMRRHLDDASPQGPYVRKEILVTDTRTGRVVAEVAERVRLYEPDELDALLGAAGLVPVGSALGEFDGRPHGPDTPRWIRVAERVRGRRG